MKRLFIIFICVLPFITMNGYGQDNPIVPLKIGDKVPNVIITHLLRNEHDIPMADLYRNNVLIINFWATWCQPCIRELPILDSLAAVDKGKLNVLSVAYEKQAIVDPFFKKHPGINMSYIHISTDDKVLIKYFKHFTIPHNIWIDKQGVVRYITGAEEITAKNISNFMDNQPMDLHPKTDITSFDIWAPFHLSDNVFIYRSIFTSYIDGIPGGYTANWVWRHPTERWLNRYFTYTSSKQQMLWHAINRLMANQDYYHIVKIVTSDSTRFFWPEQCRQTFSKSTYKSRSEWKYKNTYCYELTLPQPANDTVFFADVLNDLERIFNVKVSVENKIIPTCVLKLKRGYTFKTPMNDSTYISLQQNHLSAHNVEVLHLFNFLNEKIKTDKNKKSDDPPYVDETGIKTRIDLDVDFGKDHPTYTEVKNMISQKYGILFVDKSHPYPITIIKDLTP
jgi:thiol-disulfide isomerase/thioredoxin